MLLQVATIVAVEPLRTDLQLIMSMLVSVKQGKLSYKFVSIVLNVTNLKLYKTSVVKNTFIPKKNVWLTGVLLLLPFITVDVEWS